MTPEPTPSAYVFDIGGTLLALDQGEVAVDTNERVEIHPGVVDTLKSLPDVPLVAVTNQSGITAGRLTKADVAEWLRQVAEAAGRRFTALAVCPHAVEDGCLCRKPAPHMVLRLAAEQDTDLGDAVMVGDSPDDRVCAAEAGVGVYEDAARFFGRNMRGAHMCC